MEKGNADKLILPEPSHVGYVTRDINRTINTLERLCGLGPFKLISPDYTNKQYHGKPEDFKMLLAFFRKGSMVLELIQPSRGKTIYEDFMQKHGEGVMHHLGYEIDNLNKWISAYAKSGIKPIFCGERPGLKWAYFDTGEIIIELLERTSEGVVV